MDLLNDGTAMELVGGMRAARSAAREVVDERVSRGKARLHASTKTRKSALTRKRIMKAASDLMVERGNTAFQMSEVSERCDMSKGSLYYYFADKDELIAAIFDESVDMLVDEMEALVESSASASDALRALYAEFTRRLRGGSPLALAMTYELARSNDVALSEVTSHFSRASKVIATQLERAKAEGLVRADVDSEIAAVFATGGLVATSLVVASHQTDESAEEISNNLLNMILRGMGTEKPLS